MKKNILITGCSSGLGLALTNLYLQKGYKVFGLSRKKPPIENKNFEFKQIDLSKTLKIKELLEEYLLNIKEFELVYLNAGILGEIKTLDLLSLDEMKEVFEINVFANKEILDILAKCKVEKILAISSGASINGSKGWASYSLSKAGINMLINLYAKELINTKLYAIAPGVIKTPMTDYIRFEIDEEIFPSAKRLKEGEIQTPKEAAQRVDKTLEKLETIPSGSFIDVRKI
ncbi:short-chain dehydrogenase [Malaciobacter mytili]|uniref:SDR family NAD(P)-dependent oxidoreductase n=1 Tax=Malaciobacter mytili TaxID=603050 RepID=UPI00100A8442|nr:SDR family NAD(P)-dependent oxidoreductase [Malaciobacter mytili]RXI43623.1 short-chain dehydrogenase [Malaciobacter mytili]